MVAVLGHLAMALLVSLPAWVFWDGRVTLTFVGLSLPAAMLPDVDRYLPWVAHYGPTHTVAFVTAVALVAGAVIAVAAERLLTRWWVEDEGRFPNRSTIYAFAVGALLVGGLSHLLADLLSAGAMPRPIEPFWPFLERPATVQLVREFTEPAWNVSLLIIAVTAHVGLFLVERR